MSRKYKFYYQKGIYFVTLTTINWMDVFTRNIYKDIFMGSLSWCVQNRGLEVYAYCVMTNHIHLIVGNDREALSHTFRDLKNTLLLES